MSGFEAHSDPLEHGNYVLLDPLTRQLVLERATELHVSSTQVIADAVRATRPDRYNVPFTRETFLTTMALAEELGLTPTQTARCSLMILKLATSLKPPAYLAVVGEGRKIEEVMWRPQA